MTHDLDAIKTEIRYRQRLAKIELARRNFWHYCNALDPDGYKPNRKHLKIFCKVLQNFYELKLKLKSGKIAKNLMIAMPPRHYKTRTLTLFSAWVLGKNIKHATITAAYNDDLAVDFSKFTRDTIQQDKNDPWRIVYSDIFPQTMIKPGSGSMKKWAVVGSHFSYKGAGVGGTITGIGGNTLIIDDPVKDAETAYNENALDKLWLWYTGTWLSRQEHGALKIITHTPWAKKDISGRILSGPDAENWYVLSMPACLNEDTGEMLCPEILSYEEYKDLERNMDEYIFAANYRMLRLDQQGMLYKQFSEWSELPRNEKGEIPIIEKVMICDTAAQGEDYLCAGFGVIIGDCMYEYDFEYTQEDIDKTEERVAKKLIDGKVQVAFIENNSGGHSFAYHVQKILKEKYHWTGTAFIEFPQKKNKEGRIFAHNVEVNKNIIMPIGWRYTYPEFYRAVMEYSRIGKNKHDDAPDMLTLTVEYMRKHRAGALKIKNSWRRE